MNKIMFDAYLNALKVSVLNIKLSKCIFFPPRIPTLKSKNTSLNLTLNETNKYMYHVYICNAQNTWD